LLWQWGAELDKYSTDSSQYCRISTVLLIATDSVAAEFMCRPAGWSPTHRATPFGKNRRKFHIDFSRVTPLPLLIRATEAPGGLSLSLGFFTLGFVRFSPEMRLAFDSLDDPNGYPCLREILCYLTIEPSSNMFQISFTRDLTENFEYILRIFLFFHR